MITQDLTQLQDNYFTFEGFGMSNIIIILPNILMECLFLCVLQSFVRGGEQPVDYYMERSV